MSNIHEVKIVKYVDAFHKSTKSLVDAIESTRPIDRQVLSYDIDLESNTYEPRGLEVTWYVAENEEEKEIRLRKEADLIERERVQQKKLNERRKLDKQIEELQKKRDSYF